MGSGTITLAMSLLRTMYSHLLSPSLIVEIDTQAPKVTGQDINRGAQQRSRIMELAATNPAVLAQLDPADYLGTMGTKEFDRVEKAINEAKG